MHLFHEMKQEFPTIPDTIVTQLVNENCHQRENCIQMLRNELELNPIPVQSYPAKVLHPPQNQNPNQNHNSSHSHSYNNHVGTPPPPPPLATKPPLQQKPNLGQQKPPLKPPLKPVRPAPLHPPTQQQQLTSISAVNQNNSSSNGGTTSLGQQTNSTNSPRTQRKTTSSGVQLGNNGTAPPLRRQAIIKPITTGDVGAADLEGGSGAGVDINEMPTKNLQQLNSTRENHTPPRQEVNTNPNNNRENCSSGGGGGIGETTTNDPNTPRARPTTLNLNTTSQQQQQQQQQRQRLNVQLQEHFLQQRHKQQTTSATIGLSTAKPLRKAPLPPIAPKPILSQHHHQHHHPNNNNGGGDSLSQNQHHHPSNNNNSLSPLSESEISLNVSLTTTPSSSLSPTTNSLSSNKTHHTSAATATTTTPTQHLQNKSPVRHRSVITLQPEPPYTRDFFQTAAKSTTSSSPCGTPATLTPTTVTSSSVVSSPTNSAYSGTGSQKSYTSVNLTLRPPTTVLNSALQPSAIDITAGPGFSGASGGGKSLSYSSTSYDARLGYQQNFHITVTDEGGVFSASRRRPQPRNNANQVNICENQYDGNSDGDKFNHVNSLYAEQQQLINQNQQQYLQQQQQQHQQHHQQQLQQQQNQQFHNIPDNNIKSPQGIGSGEFGKMCLAPQQAEDGKSTREWITQFVSLRLYLPLLLGSKNPSQEIALYGG